MRCISEGVTLALHGRFTCCGLRNSASRWRTDREKEIRRESEYKNVKSRNEQTACNRMMAVCLTSSVDSSATCRQRRTMPKFVISPDCRRQTALSDFGVLTPSVDLRAENESLVLNLSQSDRFCDLRDLSIWH